MFFVDILSSSCNTLTSFFSQHRSGWGSYQFATLVAKNVWQTQEMTSTSSTYPPRAFSSPCGKERLRGKQRAREVYQNKNRDVLSSKVSSENKTSNKLFICNLLHHTVDQFPSPSPPPSTQPPSAVLNPDAWKIAANPSVNLICHVCARADLSEASRASDPLPYEALPSRWEAEERVIPVNKDGPPSK